jgi:hypothetical protein
MDGKTKAAQRTRAAAEAVADPRAFSEDSAVENDLLARRIALLTERFAGDDEVLLLIEHHVLGGKDPSEVRALTGWTARTFNLTRLRMLRGAAKVAQDLGGRDDEPALAPFADPDADENDDDDSEVA